MKPVTVPRDSIYALQRSLKGVDLVAAWTEEGASEKKPSKISDVAFHPVRPWLAAMDGVKGAGFVWNYDTNEIVREFSLDTGSDNGTAGDGAGAEEAIGAPPATLAFQAKNLLQKTASPTATTPGSFVKATRGKATQMLFYDHEAIMATTLHNTTDRVCFEEWIIILTASNVFFCDVNQTTAMRTITSEDLQRQVPTSIAILPTGLLAIGCQDGKIRVWNPRIWKYVDTMDTGSAKDVQHLALFSSDGDPNCRSASGISINGNPMAQWLVSVTLDGKLSFWKMVPSGEGWECGKLDEIDLKDAVKTFDTSSGVNEIKMHYHQEMMTVATKEGIVFFVDLTSLLRQNRSASLVGILPATAKLQGALVIASVRKGSFVVISISPSTSTLTVSELVNKGRLVGKDSVPSNFHEFAVGMSFESKDLKGFVTQGPAKKIKVTSLASSNKAASDFCCITNFGVLVLNTCCLPDGGSTFIVRGQEKTPLLAYPSTAKIGLRFFGEETSVKQEDHKLQGGTDAANEKLKTPILHSCPSNPEFLAALLPACIHLEILQMDTELRNQKSISMHMIFSGNAIAIAWHPARMNFALLVPHEPSSRRLTRATSSTTVTPRRRGFMFGGSTKGVGGDEAGGTDAKRRASMARAMSLVLYGIHPDGHVELVDENVGGGEDQLLHIFSGPFLGVVKNEDEDSSAGNTSSTDGKSDHEARSLARNKRTESAVLTSNSSFSTVANDDQTDASDLKKTYIEFYDWGDMDKHQDSSTMSAKSGVILRKVGAAIECPLLLEWETVTRRFCALVYEKSVCIYRVTSSPVSEVTCIHEIPTTQTVQSIKWVHHTLFLMSVDEIKCCIFSKAKYFTFDLASRFAPDQGCADLYDFPKPQRFPAGSRSILTVANQQLILSGQMQTIRTIDLSNKVLQCCMLISLGQPDLAVQVAEALNTETRDWIGSCFEAFGFATQAMKLSRLSLRFRVNMCIKHNLLECLPQLLKVSQADSADLTGISLFQRACTSLYRAQQVQALEELLTTLRSDRNRSNDMIFVASLLRKTEPLAQVLASNSEYGAAFHLLKHSGDGPHTSLLPKWNDHIHAATSAWKSDLERQSIRAPESLALTSS